MPTYDSHFYVCSVKLLLLVSMQSITQSLYKYDSTSFCHICLSKFLCTFQTTTLCVEISFNQVVEFLPWGLHFLSQVCASKPKTDFLPFSRSFNKKRMKTGKMRPQKHSFALITQPMMQRRPNPTELKSMDSYTQLFCRFQKSKQNVPLPSLPCIKKSPFTPYKIFLILWGERAIFQYRVVTT